MKTITSNFSGRSKVLKPGWADECLTKIAKRVLWSLCCLCAFVPGYAQVTSVGPQSPTSNTSTGVNNPANGYSSNNQYAVFDASGDLVNYANFNLAIPAGASVTGIEVILEGNRSNDRDLQVSLSANGGSSFTTAELVPDFSGSDATRTVGGKFFDWGRTWLSSDFSNANFRVQCRVPSAATGSLNLDHVQVRVYYAGGMSVFSSSGSFAVPAGVASIGVDAWGAGGGGSSGSNPAGGGGGGAYTSGVFTGILPSSTLTVAVGAGGNPGSNGGFSRVSLGANNVTANGGNSGSGRTGGSGGSASAVSGLVTVSFAGGSGGNARSSSFGGSNEAGGGGGGSAFTSSVGLNGANGGSDDDNNPAGGLGTGNGGRGATADGTPNAQPGIVPGGGGGGRGEGSSNSQAGADGRVILTYNCPSYGITATSASASVCSSNGTAIVTLSGNAGDLPVGSYTVTYNRSSPSATGLTSAMQVTTAGTGTINLTGLTTVGNAVITITKIASGDCSTDITTGNVSNTIVVTAAPSVSAGNSLSMCASESNINVTAGATASSYSSITWSSSGTGTFINENSLTQAVYSPSVADFAAGSVTITLTANGIAPCGNVSSAKTLTFSQVPTASAGGMQTICQNQTATVSGASASNGTITWTENGAGSITSGGNTLSPVYTPAPADAGTTVTLTMTVSNSPCLSATATYAVQVLAAPSVNAGGDLTTCANSGAINITVQATASNTDGIQWTTSGSGTIDNPTSLTEATYTPSVADIAAGTVTLTLTGNGFGSCASVVSTKTLTINEILTVSSATVCNGSSGQLVATSACRLNAPQSTSSFAGSGSTSGSGTAWTGTGNISASDNSRATATRNDSGTSQEFQASGFGFNIPAQAVILGIEARIEKSRSGLAIGNVQDNAVRLLKGGQVQAANKAISGNWPGSDQISIYGSASDTWGSGWTASDINNAGFGVSIIANFSVTFGGVTANIDAISIQVTYALPGDVRWYTVASGGAPIAVGTSFNPVGVPGSGINDTLTAGTTTYYAECSNVEGCRTPATFTILPLTEVAFTSLEASYCADELPVVISANQSTGTFAGEGLTDNGDGTATVSTWTGSQQISFTHVDENGCSVTVTGNLTVIPLVQYFADADADGFGDAATSVWACSLPEGYVPNSTDCDDTNDMMNAMHSFFVDADGDGAGAGSIVQVCAVDSSTPPAGYSMTDSDCDDSDATKSAMYMFYVDADGDEVGAGEPVSVCAVDGNTPPFGYSMINTDCDDADFASQETFAFYVDGDNDGYGAGAVQMLCAPDAMTPPPGFSPFNTDCNDSNAAVSPGLAEIGYNLIDDDCDGIVDEGFPAKSSVLLPQFCNLTLHSMDQPLLSTLVGGAQGYRWKVTTMSGPNAGQVQFIDTALRTMRITQLQNYAFNTVYHVEVAVYYTGYLQPYTSTTCTITTPTPVAQLGVCNATLFNMSDYAYANLIPFATGYRFRVTDPLNPANVEIVDHALRSFRMTSVTSFDVKYNKTYNVEVAIRNTTGEYLPFGPACSITTPAFPTVALIESQCDNGMGDAYDVPSVQTQIFAASYPGVLKYAFRLTGPGLPAEGAEVIKNLRVFTLADFASSNLIPGAVYNVNVRLIFNGDEPAGPYGKTCSIRTPGVSRLMQREFSAVLYPNPFVESFNLQVDSPSNASVGIEVFDMVGRLMSKIQLDPTKQKQMTLGADYPSGVYQIVVRQGDEIKTLRVVKR